MRSLLAVLTCVSLALPLSAQTANVAAFNSMTVNGIGAGATGPINLVFAAGTQASLVYSALPNSPIILAVAAGTSAGAIVIGPNNIVDLDLGTLAFLVDGTGALLPSPLSPFFHTNSSGAMNFIVPNAVPPAPAAIAAQSGLINPSYATGLQVSAAFRLGAPTFPPGNPAAHPMAVPVPGAGDDTSTLIDITPNNLPNWFTFYGTSYSNLYANSNGNVSTAIFTTLAESAATFASTTGGAKICALWDDLNPAVGGTFTYYVDDTPGAEVFEVTWTNVPEFSIGGSNSFKITITSGSIVMDYGALGSLDNLIGVSSGTSGTGLPIILGTGVPLMLNTTATVQSPYQLFTAASPNYTANGQITWVLGTSGGSVPGTPILQF
jgi:hypothetical protein